MKLSSFPSSVQAVHAQQCTSWKLLEMNHFRDVNIRLCIIIIMLLQLAMGDNYVLQK